LKIYRDRKGVHIILENQTDLFAHIETIFGSSLGKITVSQRSIDNARKFARFLDYDRTSSRMEITRKIYGHPASRTFKWSDITKRVKKGDPNVEIRRLEVERGHYERNVIHSMKMFGG